MKNIKDFYPAIFTKKSFIPFLWVHKIADYVYNPLVNVFYFKNQNINVLTIFLLVTAATVASIFSANAQSYPVNIQTKELGSGTNLSGIYVTLIDTVNNVQRMGTTDANGNLSLNVPSGNYKTFILDPDAIDKHIGFVKKNYVVNSSKNNITSLIEKDLVGPNNLWTYSFDPTFFKTAFDGIFVTGNPFYFDHVVPIYTVISAANSTDSTRLLQVFNGWNTNLGFEAFKVMNPTSAPSDRYTFYANSDRYTSNVGTDINGVIVGSSSRVISTSPLKVNFHESFRGGFAGIHKTYIIPTILESDINICPESPLPIDYGNAWVAVKQGVAKRDGLQTDFTLIEMRDYFALSATAVPQFLLSSVSSRNVHFRFTPDERNRFYDLVIKEGTNVVFNHRMTTTNDTTIVLSPGSYVAELAAGNAGGTSGLSSITFTIPNDLPGNTSITSPSNNATKVSLPVQYTLSTATNATSYQIQLSANAGFNPVLKDTTVNNTNPLIPLSNGTGYYTRARGKNNDGDGPWSPTVFFTTIKQKPGNTAITYPANNATEITQPISFACNAASNTETYRFILYNAQDVQLLDTTLNTNGFNYNKLSTNRLYKIKASALNSDLSGDWSATISFTTFNNPPGAFSITKPVNNTTISYSGKKLEISSSASTDADGDVLFKSYHITGPGLDTVIQAGNTESVYLDSARLQNDKQYAIAAEVSDGTKTTQAGGISFTTPKITGLEDIFAGGKVRIYPNPFTNVINIETKGPVTREILLSVYSSTGKLLMAKTLYKPFETIQMPDLGVGLYLLKISIQGKTGAEKVFRVMKE